MKHCKVSLMVVLFLAVCLPAVAQSGIKVDVPFNFTVAGKAMPAGHYTVVPVFRSDSVAWRIYGGKENAIMLTEGEESGNKPHNPSMIFLPTSNGYALVQFWPNGHLGRVLTAPQVEHTLLAQTDKYVEIGVK
jgi:hypothetical protein